MLARNLGSRSGTQMLRSSTMLRSPAMLPPRSRLAAVPSGVRYKSEIATEIGKVSPDAGSATGSAADAIANAANSATDKAVGIVEHVADVASAVPPDQIGYFQSVGLAQSWVWPEYIFQHVMEYVHVYTGMPWWATISAVTSATRTMMLPSYSSSSDAAARMARIKPELTVLMERTKTATDQRDVQKAMLERRQLMKANNIKVSNMAKPLLSVPVFLGFFNALRGMSHVPVDGLTTQGLAWFHNLAAMDPYCGSQIITATSYAATFKFFGGETGAAQVSPVMKKVFTYMPFIAVPSTMSSPASVCFYFAINSVFSVIQSNVLKSEWLRKTSKLAPMVTPAEQAEINKRLGTDPAAAQNDSIMGASRKRYQDAKDQAERRVAEEERKKAAEAKAKLEMQSRYIQFQKPKK